MTALVVGATGATGRLLVRELLHRGLSVRVIVRSLGKLPDDIRDHPGLHVIHADISRLSDAAMNQCVNGCDAVASCLGHTMSFSGVFGAPRLLVSDAVRKLCDAVKASGRGRSVRFVLMNSAGVRNRDMSERTSFGEACVIRLLRTLLPPHIDNEQAAEYLRAAIGRNDREIEWAVVRPDTLLDEDEVGEYEVRGSPSRSAIFDPGVSSRINVSHFMAGLMTRNDLWAAWRGQMPVLYNKASSGPEHR